MKVEFDYIIHWETLLAESSRWFSYNKGLDVSSENVLEALFMVLEEKKYLEWIGDVYDQELNLQEIIEVLKSFDFGVFDNVVRTEEIIPRELRINYKVRVKDSGIIWIIHKYDQDPFPSNPHAHNIDNNFKLHLGNGICFKKREKVYQISRKNLLEIRKKIENSINIKLPDLDI